MNALADRRDAQRELTGEIEQAELEALITRAIDVQAPKDDEWHDEGHAEDLKAYAAANWLICSDEITRTTRQSERDARRRALATLGAIEGYAVGGCCDLSTSTHHLVQRLGVEQGYNLAKESGRDLEEGIACATAGLRRRFAARVWRDYYKHVDARRRYANPTDEGLIAQQRDRQIEEESRRRENEERVAQYNYFAARASNRSAWARAGMG